MFPLMNVGIKIFAQIDTFKCQHFVIVNHTVYTTTSIDYTLNILDKCY